MNVVVRKSRGRGRRRRRKSYQTVVWCLSQKCNIIYSGICKSNNHSALFTKGTCWFSVCVCESVFLSVWERERKSLQTLTNTVCIKTPAPKSPVPLKMKKWRASGNFLVALLLKTNSVFILWNLNCFWLSKPASANVLCQYLPCNCKQFILLVLTCHVELEMKITGSVWSLNAFWNFTPSFPGLQNVVLFFQLLYLFLALFTREESGDLHLKKYQNIKGVVDW